MPSEPDKPTDRIPRGGERDTTARTGREGIARKVTRSITKMLVPQGRIVSSDGQRTVIRVTITKTVLVLFFIALIATNVVTWLITTQVLSRRGYERSPDTVRDFYLPRNPPFSLKLMEERAAFLSQRGGNTAWDFIAYGDHRSSGGDSLPQLRHWRIAGAMAGYMLGEQRRQNSDFDFILSTGDLAKDDLGGDWEVFYRARDLFAPAVPYVTVRGDHDAYLEYYRRVHEPVNLPGAGNVWYWALPYRGVLLIGLDTAPGTIASLEEGQPQYEFLFRQFDLYPGFPAIVICHKPPHTTGHHAAGAVARKLDERLRKEYPGVVRLWLCGDNHSYERLTSPPDARGVKTHYLLLGGGGAPLRPQDHVGSLTEGFVSECWAMVNNFVRVSVTPDHVRIRTFEVDPGDAQTKVTPGIRGVRTPGGESVTDDDIVIPLR